MGEAKTRAERRRAEREAATVVIVAPDREERPTRRYRQKLVDFVPEIYDMLVGDLNGFNAVVAADERQTFDSFLNSLVVLAIEYRREMRRRAEEAARLVQPAAPATLDQVLANYHAKQAAR